MMQFRFLPNANGEQLSIWKCTWKCVAEHQQSSLSVTIYCFALFRLSVAFASFVNRTNIHEVRSRGVTRKDFERGFWHYKAPKSRSTRNEFSGLRGTPSSQR